MDWRACIVDITHPEYGVVEGVSDYEYKWMKNGAWYYAREGWKKVPQPHWVDVTSECRISKRQAILHRGNCTQVHPYRRSMRDGCIIIEREVVG